MGGLIEQSSSECHGFLYSDVFKRVMEAVNNVDVGEFGAGSLPGVQAHAQPLVLRKVYARQNKLHLGSLKVNGQNNLPVFKLTNTPIQN